MKEILTIGEQLLRTTVLINIKNKDSLTSGTGFLFYSHKNIFLVTNRPVSYTHLTLPTNREV